MHHIDNLGTDTFDLCFLKTGIHRGMVLEPLRVPANDFRPAARFLVPEIGNSLPAGLQTQRIPVCFYEAVRIINLGIRIFHPANTVIIPLGKVSAAVIIHQLENVLPLTFIFRHFRRFLQTFDHLLQRLGIQPAYPADSFLQLPFRFDQAGVQPVRQRMPDRLGMRLLVGGTLMGIKRLRLLGAHALIVIAGGCLQQTQYGIQIDPLGIQARVEQHRNQEFRQFRFAPYPCQPDSVLLVCQGVRQLGNLSQDRLHVGSFHQVNEIIPAETGLEFVARIMMMHAVAEPDPFQEDHESTEAFRIPVSGISPVNGFQYPFNQ